MILTEATKKYKGYDPSTLTKGSTKRICCSCDSCGRVRWVICQAYRSLCGSCSKSGEFNSQYGKPRSNEVKAKISKTLIENETCKGSRNPMFGRKGELSPHWKGGFNILRPYLLPELQCIKLNQRFSNSEFHHIMSSVGVYIPKELHKSISHSLKNNQNMNKINTLAMDYLVYNF